jgi:hypothetical protein
MSIVKRVSEMTDEELDAELAALEETVIPSSKPPKAPRRLDDPAKKPKKKSWRDALLEEE